jgi:predicted tellurium resistance membrane protein TerC
LADDDIALPGDNAIIIGMAAETLAPELRNKGIAYGIAAAIFFRISLAALTFYLLEIPGLKLIGMCVLFLRLLPVVVGFVQRRRYHSRTFHRWCLRQGCIGKFRHGKNHVITFFKGDGHDHHR